MAGIVTAANTLTWPGAFAVVGIAAALAFCVWVLFK
jgi:ABC-type transporter Mla subunit MlaD